jgi:farnesyl-diphosphate farnesyltransferase
VRPLRAIIAALPEEVAALRRRLRNPRATRAGDTPVTLGQLGRAALAIAVVGEGPSSARRGTVDLLTALPLAEVVLVGVSGALGHELLPAALVVGRAVRGGGTTLAAPPALVDRAARATGAIPGLVVTVDDLLETAAAKARVRSRLTSGPAVADLESAVIVAALEAAEIPWTVLRSVSDTADEELPEVIRRCRDEGGLHRARLVAQVLRRPTSAAALWRLGRRMWTCSRMLAAAVEELVRLEDLPDVDQTPGGHHLAGRADERTTMTSLETLLARTSRTFALSITFLPEALRHEVTIAYLLFRVADTLEDADRWPHQVRAQALDDLARVMETADPASVDDLVARWRDPAPLLHPGYRELLAQTRFVLEAFEALPESRREVIRGALLRTIAGMKAFLVAAEGDVMRLETLDELRRYCYVVAGIVGEMLTGLFLLHEPMLNTVAPFLEERASRFGEALQLINILKDRDADEREGRHYLPPGVPLSEVIALARRCLHAAEEYTDALQAAGAQEVLAFNLLLVRLARASLVCVEEHGPGAKISRLEVLAIVAGVQGEVAAVRVAAAGAAAALGDA